MQQAGQRRLTLETLGELATPGESGVLELVIAAGDGCPGSVALRRLALAVASADQIRSAPLGYWVG